MAHENTSSVLNNQTDHAQNESVPHGCITVRFSEMDYLPWNNSDNIVSAHVPAYVGKVRSNVLPILLLIGGPANAINMAVFFKQNLKDRVNLLLFSLSLSDEIYLITIVLHYVDEFYSQFVGGATKPRVLMFMMNNNVTGLCGLFAVSFLLSAILACERCCCVLWPLAYPTLMRTRTLAVLIVAVFVVVPGLFFIVAFKFFVGCVYDPDTGVESTAFLQHDLYVRHKTFIDYLDNGVFGVGLPTAALVVVVTATAITMVQLRRAATWRAESASSSACDDRELALTKMLVGVALLLIVCVSPVCLLRVANLFLPELNMGGRNHNLYLVFLNMGVISASVNSSFNIFIYYKMGSRYRDTFRALFKRKAFVVMYNGK